MAVGIQNVLAVLFVIETVRILMANMFHGRQQNPHQYADNGNHNQQFDESKFETSSNSFHDDILEIRCEISMNLIGFQSNVYISRASEPTDDQK